jgi:hypothetical protein
VTVRPVGSAWPKPARWTHLIASNDAYRYSGQAHCLAFGFDEAIYGGEVRVARDGLLGRQRSNRKAHQDGGCSERG